MKKPKPKKHRPTLTPTALAWLAFNCPPERWDRIRELYDRRQIEAIFAYLKLATDEPTDRHFESNAGLLNRPARVECLPEGRHHDHGLVSHVGQLSG